MPSSITINKFDNEPFVRQLTATANGIPSNTNSLIWFIPTQNLVSVRSASNNLPYTPYTPGVALSTSTLIIAFTSTTYDFTTEGYTVNTLPISCLNVTTDQITATSINYDTFPNINFQLGINYEKTNTNSYFYRLTSTTPLSADIKFLSNAYNFVSGLSTQYYDSWFTVNNTTTKNRTLSTYSENGFVRSIKSLSSINATLCAWSAQNSLSSFWSPHRFDCSLSAVFVPSFLSADFIGWPKYYFANINGVITVFTLTSSSSITDITPSQGMEFYGEGHTETIFLSAKIHPPIVNYIWRLNNSTTQYPLIINSLTSASVSISSALENDFKIPVSLHVVNSNFLSTDPYFYYDDLNGKEIPYPYYSPTIDSNGNELITNTKFHKSIYVKPYDPLQFVFSPGVSSQIFLPINGDPVFYQASLVTAFSGTSASDACYGKYGVLWKWSTFEGCSATSTFFNRPSSWSTTQCTTSTLDISGNIITVTPGNFPKRWWQEPPLSAELFNTNPINCLNDSGISWSLSSTTGWSVSTLPIIYSNVWDYQLRLRDLGQNNFTTSYFENTNLVLNAKQDVTCQISRSSVPNDWLPRTRTIDAEFNFTSIAPPNVRFYTSNRYVLVDTNVVFENLITQTDLINEITIDFDEGNVVTYTSPISLPKNFIINYKEIGRKSINTTIKLTYTGTPLVVKISDIIEVISEYDTVEPTLYRSTASPVNLPWPNKPKVYSNDWIVEDNINSCFKKFYENLTYLNLLGKKYIGDVTEYYGYLGNQPTIINGVTACPVWTWEDTDCTTANPLNTVTWGDVFLSDQPQENGRYVNCGTWEQQDCKNAKISPNCTQKYCVEWNWRQRKRTNTLEPITWADAKCTGVYNKRWIYEPCEIGTITVCDEGIWNVNISGLNRFYNNISPTFTTRCFYNGVASRNNILYTVQNTQIKLLSSDYTATYFDYLNTLDGVTSFVELKNICLDSSGKLYVLDKILSQVAVYIYDREAPGSNFKLLINWGGVGTLDTKNKFFSPNDIHLDQQDSVWVTDTGNNCIKHYSNSGTWLNTIFDETLKTNTPLSVAVDSDKNVHVLTNKNIQVYSYAGTFLREYEFSNIIKGSVPVRINASYNREILYVVFDKQVLKFFKNGVFAGYVIQEKENVYNITGIYHDEFRNILITNDDKILKYPDLMTLKSFKGTLPVNYWQLNDLLIHKEEYIQNWVYTKSFERLWDNIELFKNTLHYTTQKCKQYKLPTYDKTKMTVGQNEIVTTAVINRILGYLWSNFSQILEFYDPSCID